MVLIEENGKKNHDTKIIRNFVEGLNKVIYEFWANNPQISRSYWEYINIHWFSGVRRFQLPSILYRRDFIANQLKSEKKKFWVIQIVEKNFKQVL